jgi:hypothetical protein
MYMTPSKPEGVCPRLAIYALAFSPWELLVKKLALVRYKA